MSASLFALLVACNPPPVAADAPAPPPATPADALDAFYAGWQVDLPTAPASLALPDTVTTLVLGSCLQPSLPAPILAAMNAVNADAAILLGDNVYGDARSGDVRLPELRSAYARLAALPGFVKLAESTPLMVIWDDHDYGMNDAGASFSPKRFAERIFEDFWRLPADDPRRSRAGVYTSHTFGAEGQRLQVVLLDTRMFKDDFTPTDERVAGKERYVPAPVPGATMLGVAQWEWLAEVLQEPAELRLLVSSMQVHADGHGWERWGLLPAERDRLYAALADRNGGGVVVVSGDRHRAGIYDRPDLPGGPYPEMTTSSLNLTFDSGEEAGPHRIGPTFIDENFGVLTLDWAAKAGHLSVRDIDGKEVLGHAVAW